MTTPTQRALAKAIKGAPTQVALAPPQPLSLTRGTIAAIGQVTNGVPTTYVQLPGSKQNVPAEVAVGYGAKVGDTVEVLVAPPRLIVLGTTSNLPSGVGIDSSAYKSLTGMGETDSPGDLTQDGGLTVSSAGSMGIQMLTTAPSDTTWAIAIADETTQGIEIFTEGQCFVLAEGQASIVGSPVVIGTWPAPGCSITLSPNFPFITILTEAVPFFPVSFNLLTSNGDPNGVLVGGSVGSLCVDVSTPALWIATTAFGTIWSKVGP